MILVRVLSFDQPITGQKLLDIFERIAKAGSPHIQVKRQKFSETYKLWIEVRKGTELKKLIVTLSTSAAPLLVHPNATYRQLALRCDESPRQLREWRDQLTATADNFVTMYNKQIDLLNK